MKETLTFPPSSILCPVDFSDLSDLALKYAAAGARAFGANLVVFHAQRIELPPYFTSSQMRALKKQRQEEKAWAKDFLRLHVKKVLGTAAAGIRIKYDLEEAHPVDAILAAAQRHKAGLIVMGTHGRGGAKRIWLGSVLENVVRQAGIPVFAVRQKQHEFIDASNPQHLPRLETILCPINFSPAAQAGLESAVSLARQFDSRLIVACVVERGDKHSTSERTEKMRTFLQRSGATACSLQTPTRKGEAGKEILSLAIRTKADLIVLGAQPRHSMQAWLWGDTTETVLRQAPVPVLVVPAAMQERR